MERPNFPESGQPDFSELYHVFSELLIQHGDFKSSWDRMRDSESSLGIPRDTDISFDLRFSKNELRENPYGFHSIWTEFTPSYTDEEGELNSATLFAQVEITSGEPITFFSSLNPDGVDTIVDTTDKNTGRRITHSSDQLSNHDVELLRRIYETVQANLA